MAGGAPVAERRGMTTTPAQISWKLSLMMSVLLLAPGVSLAANTHPALRVTAEVGAMTVTSAALGAGGYLLGLKTCDERGEGLGCLDRMAFGLLGGVTVGAPVGTLWGGELAGGQGTFLGVLLGSGAGLAVGAGASLLVSNDDLKPFCLPLGTMIGSVVGYEVSHGLATHPRIEVASAAVQPVLAFSNRGAVLGLNGIF
jgi:hypothetical protein